MSRATSTCNAGSKLAPPPSPLYFEDIEVGTHHSHTGLKVSQEAIIRFAKEFDPETYHTDPELALKSPFRGLIASGAHTLSLWRRMSFEALQPPWAAIAGAGFESIRYHRPVRPEDTLCLSAEVISKTPSRTKLDRGVVQTAEELSNQEGEIVMTLICAAVVLKRVAPQT